MTHYVDLASHMPRLGLRRDVEQRYWDDSVHFTPAGYDKLAELIYETLLAKAFQAGEGKEEGVGNGAT